MLDDKLTTIRLAVFAELADRSDVRFGRTALMKLCYFLQTLKGVQLGYEFSLYSYGPFDSDVLADLRSAENLSVLEAVVLSYSGGYQYQISTADNAALVKKLARSFLETNRLAIQSVADTFASKSASELELLSTIVFVDRDRTLNAEALRDTVRAIKPHFAKVEISNKIRWLSDNKMLFNRI